MHEQFTNNNPMNFKRPLSAGCPRKQYKNLNSKSSDSDDQTKDFNTLNNKADQISDEENSKKISSASDWNLNRTFKRDKEVSDVISEENTFLSEQNNSNHQLRSSSRLSGLKKLG